MQPDRRLQILDNFEAALKEGDTLPEEGKEAFIRLWAESEAEYQKLKDEYGL